MAEREAAAEDEDEEEEEEGGKKEKCEAEKSAPVVPIAPPTPPTPRGKKPGYEAAEWSVGTPAAAAAADSMYEDLD